MPVMGEITSARSRCAGLPGRVYGWIQGSPLCWAMAQGECLWRKGQEGRLQPWGTASTAGIFSSCWRGCDPCWSHVWVALLPPACTTGKFLLQCPGDGQPWQQERAQACVERPLPAGCSGGATVPLHATPADWWRGLTLAPRKRCHFPFWVFFFEPGCSGTGPTDIPRAAVLCSCTGMQLPGHGAWNEGPSEPPMQTGCTGGCSPAATEHTSQAW